MSDEIAIIPQVAPTALTGAEWDRLAVLEETIAAGLTTFEAVGEAMLAIRDGKLYRQQYGTFAEYVEKRWKMSRARAYQLTGAVETRAELSTVVDKAIVDGMSERAIRAARAVPDDIVAEVVTEAARMDGGIPTSTTIAALAAERTVPLAAAPVSVDAEVVTVRRDDPDMIRSLLSPKALADAHKANRAEKEAERREERIARIETIARGNRPLHFDTAFPVILADPPWRYDFAPSDNLAIENHYPTMSLEEICALPVGAIATPDAVLFLWYPPGKATEAVEVIKAWGFTERSGMVWVKNFIGPGYWARMRHEPVMIAVRGEMPVPPATMRHDSVIEHPRGAHSAKPPQLAEYIEAAYPSLPKLEMFCRAPRAGWTAWGNEAGDGEQEGVA